MRLRLVVLLILSSAVGFLAAAWAPGAWAGILGGSVTAVISAVAIGGQAEWRRRSEVMRNLSATLEVSTATGGFPLVRELTDPIAVGVHPATAINAGGTVDRVPPYITRDIEPELHDALRRGEGFILLVGESAAGKTRAAFEGMRLLLGDYRFVAPNFRDALRALLEILKETGDYVVWLDDLERFLGSGGLTTASLQLLLVVQVRTVVFGHYARP